MELPNHQRMWPRRHLPLVIPICWLAFVALLCFPMRGNAQIVYRHHLSDLRIQELRNLAISLQHSINSDQYACESYYDYVCSNNRPLYTILGHQPDINEVIKLFADLSNDPTQFEAKQKLMDFFISCNIHKSVEDCYRETFVYFKPLFGYILNKKYLETNSHDYRTFLELLQRFIRKSEHTENFQRNRIRTNLMRLKDKFHTPQLYFQAADLNREYQALPIYRDGYQYNLRNLEQHRKRNSTYEVGLQRTMLDWSFYMYQSRNKPLSYYFPTLNVHLWMTLYNTTERQRDEKSSQQIAECLRMPQFVSALEEARVLALMYLKSFRSAWQDYRDWITSLQKNQEIFDQENAILREYHMDNKRIFFTLYAQNFCQFGKELAENVFYLGLKQNQDFFNIYACGYQTELNNDCI